MLRFHISYIISVSYVNIFVFRRGTPQPSGGQQQAQQQSQGTQAQEPPQSCTTPQPAVQRASTPVTVTDAENQKTKNPQQIVESPSKPTQTVSPIF